MVFSEAWLVEHQKRMLGIRSKGTTTAQVGVEVAPKTKSRHRSGIRSDIGPQSFRSSWEANWGRYLNWLVDRGEIAGWSYEPKEFWFLQIKRGVRSYKPDFLILPTDGSEPFYQELKGYLDARSKTKLKRMRIYHPTVRVDLVDAAQYKAIARTVAGLIPNWE